MIEQIAGIVAAYGIMFTAVWKLESFVVKRTDIQISELSNQYNKVVIANDFRNLQSEKKGIQKQTLDKIRCDLNMPNDMDAARNDANRNGKHAFVAISISAILSIIAYLFPGDIGGVNIFLIPLFSLVPTFMFLTNYYTFLNEVRHKVSDMEKAIQNAESLQIITEEAH